MPSPYYFDEFFASGLQETISPFLIPSSRKWGKNLSLRLALLAALFFIAACATFFTHIYISHIFLLIVYFLVGTPALIGALEDLSNLEINIDVLMTLAALLSVAIGSGMEGGLLLVLFELSAALEGFVEQKTKSTLIALKELTPTKAQVLSDDGSTHECSLKEVRIAQHILIKAGEVVPLDGVVLAGSSFVNLAHLTGESLPIPMHPGSEVPAGARNLEGTLTVKVVRTMADSTLSHIIHLIVEAQSAKPRLERLLHRFSPIYASSIIALSLLFALLLPPLFSLPYLGHEGSIYRALSFLIAASPCALILSTPTAYLSAISACSRKGILLKGGVIFDALTKCTQIAFDKTGTLTTGKLTLVRTETLLPHSAIDEQKALLLAASLEKHAVHPIAEALVQKAKKSALLLEELTRFQAISGAGLLGEAQGISLVLGNARFIDEHIPESLKGAWEEKREQLIAGSGMFTLLLAGEALFAFFFKDELRKNVEEMSLKLKDAGLMLWMLTGDRLVNAEPIAQEAHIDEVRADLKPEEKLHIVSERSKMGGLAMVGEGVNDAPALARATVGISLGSIGSATAVDASDVIFLRDEITLLPFLFTKSKQTLKIVRQNLFFALFVILFASLPALLGLIPLWAAVLLHEGGTILVGLNSLRLLTSPK